MIKKCDHPGCPKAGTCRAPKTRELRDYWFFCQEHAAEYNKNWNYYADMPPEEIEADWESQTFGAPLQDKKNDETDYVKFLDDFLSGRSTFDKIPTKQKLPTNISSALKVLELPITASWRDIGIKYRALAKKYHPDTAKDNNTLKFTQITEAYHILKSYHKK